MIDPERFREALAHWASGVAVAAVRDDTKVLATTVTAFLSISVEPPRVLLSLGPSAQILPFIAQGTTFGVSILGAAQGRMASVFADSYPVGASPFALEGVPLIADALVRMTCRAERIDQAGDHRLVHALVERSEVGSGDPLVRYGRAYHRLPTER